MAQKIVGGQRDFSFGEVDPDLKRADDHPARKAGLRQASNVRIRNSGTLTNRPGRSALFPFNGAARTEELTMSPGNDFKLVFSAGKLSIMNSAGAQVASFPGLPWTALNTDQIVYALLGLSIYVTFGHSMVPKVVSWDGAASWAIVDYAELIFSNQKRTPFYRISPQGITMLPGARTGSGISLVASAPVFVAGHVGTRMRFVGRQVLITAVIDSTHATVTIMESLPGHQNFGLSVDPRPSFSIGDVVNGKTSGSKGIVTAISVGGMDVQLITTNATVVSIGFFGQDQRTVSFTTGETVVGPAGSIVITSAGPIDDPTIGVALWDEEVMNAYRGYPGSVFSDQFRLGFCDFQSVPGGIAWSSINSPTDLYVGANPADAMFEIAPNKVRVYYVIPGPEGSEFVFCDRRVYYIPISETNPLKPGSVAFKTLTGDGTAQVKPHIAQEAILYINAGRSTVMAVLATGAYLRPFNTKSLTDFHAHLFNNIVCIACPNADGTFNERYAYVLNGDGSIAVGKYTADSLTSNAPVIGWSPWSGAGTVKWIAAWGADVLFTTSYFGATICEILDDTVYLDGSMFVNAPPAVFGAPVGKGPLWWIPGQSVTLMDQGTRPMGTYQIDGNGFIVPQNTGGENLLAATLIAGQPWTSVVEPFCPDMAPGSDVGQRMSERQISIFAAWVVYACSFTMAGLFSGKHTRTSPALGTIMNQRRFGPYNQDDDATQPPPNRETVEFIKPPGSTYDPRAAIIKDTPGPMQILELVIECSA